MAKAHSSARRAFALALLSAALIYAVGCGGDDDDGDKTTAEGEVETVTIGLGPYYDDQLWKVARETGIDQELGVELEVSDHPESPLKAVIGGDLDFTDSAVSSGFPVYANFPEYTDWIVTNDFRGFQLIGRAGEVKPYDDYLDENDGDFEAAKEAFVQNEVEGKSFCIVRSDFVGVVKGLLDEGGVKVDDVEIVDFATDAKAGAAFAGGECDFFTGALPEEGRLLTDPDVAGEFVAAAPHEAFGPGKGGLLFYTTMAGNRDFIDSNPELMEKLTAIWYRAARCLDENPDVVAPIVTEAMKPVTGGEIDEEGTKLILEDFNYYPTFEEAGDYYYAAGENNFATVSATQFEDFEATDPEAAEGQEPAEHTVAEDLYNSVAANEELRDYINGDPLEGGC